MRKLKENEQIDKPRSIRLSDKTWERVTKIKKRGENWEMAMDNLLNIIDQFKKIGEK